MAFASGLNAGLGFGRLQAAKRQNEISAQTQRQERVTELTDNLNNNINSVFETMAKIKENAEASGKSKEEIAKAIKPLAQRALSASQRANTLGLTGVTSPDVVEARVRNLTEFAPTREQQLENKAEEKRTLTQAETEGEIAGDPSKLSAEELERQQSVAMERINAMTGLTDGERQLQTARIDAGESPSEVLADTQDMLNESISIKPALDTGSGELRFAKLSDNGEFRGFVDGIAPQGDSEFSVSVSPDGSVSVREGPPKTGLSETEQRGLNDMESNTRSFIQTANDARQMLRENPDINTFVGKASSLVNDLQQEAKGIARHIGVEFDESQLDPSSHQETFDQLGIQNRRMQSLITSLAFQAAAASGQTGRAISDADVARFVKEVGASSADPRAFRQTLKDVQKRVARRFRTDFKVRTGNPFEDDLGIADFSDDETGGSGSGFELTPEEEALINDVMGSDNGN